MKKETTNFKLPEPPSVVLNGHKYRFEELTIEQMEIASELLEDARKRMRDQLFSETEGINKAKSITVSLADILADLRRDKKLHLFISAIMTPEEPLSDAERIADFKKCKYDKAEEIFTYFFAIGMFWKMLIPNFSAHPQEQSANREL